MEGHMADILRRQSFRFSSPLHPVQEVSHKTKPLSPRFEIPFGDNICQFGAGVNQKQLGYILDGDNPRPYGRSLLNAGFDMNAGVVEGINARLHLVFHGRAFEYEYLQKQNQRLRESNRQYQDPPHYDDLEHVPECQIWMDQGDEHYPHENGKSNRVQQHQPPDMMEVISCNLALGKVNLDSVIHRLHAANICPQRG